MEIVKKVDGGKLEILLKGRLDTLTAPQLEAEMKLDGVEELVFDLADLDYVSSAGLRLFISAMKQMSSRGGMSLRGVKPAVREVFDITGLADVFTFA